MPRHHSLALISLVVICATSVSAQKAPDFSGRWELNTSKSQNLGMMAALHDTLIITQTPTALVIKDASTFQGQANARELRYDLTGKAVSNDGPMGDHNETVAAWMNGALVTTWTKEGAVAGTTSVMTETRSLSADGKTMSVESKRGANPPLVMVFDKQ